MIGFKTVYIEGNQTTDNGVKMTLKLQHSNLTKWRNPFGGIVSLFQRDILGIVSSRSVLSCN